MSETTILVIDDSATIRKMVDSHLSKEGYRVVLAPTAEEGIEFAQQVSPNVILLDHQLPGTLGIEVARQLSEIPSAASIPVVVSSTLRKQAYIEYTDQPNVVDSLPKPYTAELLKTTVANAVENGAMIVASQSGGTAVPEVIGEQSNASMTGNLEVFGLREIIDFLNNSQHKGMLEVETELDRIYIYLAEGRVQAAVSTSFSIDHIAETLPPRMSELAPLLKFTAATGFSSQMDGLVELLDKKVLDPRMLKALLRHQAAVLLHHCFTCQNVRSFSFEVGREAPGLFAKTPLQISLAALLVDGCLHSISGSEDTGGFAWSRKAQRGQNLDRGGLDAKHMKLMSYLDDPTQAEQLAAKTGLDEAELCRVLTGLEMAEWIERREHRQTRQVLAMESERDAANLLRDLLSSDDNDLSGRVVRDRLGLQLLLKRSTPHAVILPLDNPEAADLAATVRASDELANVRIIGIGDSAKAEFEADITLTRPYDADDIQLAVDEVLAVAPV